MEQDKERTLQQYVDMKLDENDVIDYDNFFETHVLRVPNGWIYKFYTCVGDGDLSLESTTFVPEAPASEIQK